MSSPPPPQIDSPPETEAEAEPQLPLPLSASLVLTHLPQDASTALANANENDGVPEKVTIRLTPIASAPVLKQKVFKVSSSNRFETIVRFLSKKVAAAAAASGGGGEAGATVGAGGGASVFCYVNSVFAPGLDEGVGGLWRCFKTDDQLIVSYAVTPAFG